MSARITAVVPGSLAQKKRIKSGDELVSINGNEINDVLDYRFYLNDERIELVFRNSHGRLHCARIRKDEQEDIGLEFETYLMDKQRSCKNKCIFCFIDQLPGGLRRSLYFKDDDSRLSFLFGNYVTLTNVDEREIRRIIEMHISPVNVSVHTMNHELRVGMMKNPNAGKVLSYLPELANAGIKLNTQLVLCPGINDGDELKYSLEELGRLYPGVLSIAAVPVGLTSSRSKLPQLSAYDAHSAGEVIDIIDAFNDAFQAEHGAKIAYAADEFYLKAGRELPCGDYYDGFPQLENGVGMWSLLREEFEHELSKCCISEIEPRSVTVATGVAAKPLISTLAAQMCDKLKGLSVNVIGVENRLFGQGVTVAGLLPGRDIIAAVKGIPLGDELLIPHIALRREGDLFIDDCTFIELLSSVDVPVKAVKNDGHELFWALLGRE